MEVNPDVATMHMRFDHSIPSPLMDRSGILEKSIHVFSCRSWSNGIHPLAGQNGDFFHSPTVRHVSYRLWSTFEKGEGSPTFWTKEADTVETQSRMRTKGKGKKKEQSTSWGSAQKNNDSQEAGFLNDWFRRSSHGSVTAKTRVPYSFFHQGPAVGFIKVFLSEVASLLLSRLHYCRGIETWNLVKRPLVSKTGEGTAKTRSANTSDPPYGFFGGEIFPVLECRRSPQAADQWVLHQGCRASRRPERKKKRNKT
ncbi:uncharacterized protein BDW47DRAFT_112751 [Aspergillus candidus]|uniref:Uncharacterized protein n=1 Tax=Aspergillus candidus TaxID=41067 RepID=A0A2I2F0J6_ASPCN|nr:hypothetical protein BDW47DRAFT_112751 [Aspergillus candidus]PLB34137.1 hypothetical protein BDW47DRAFT_112751 [Aspergillus candidus]